MRQFENVHHNDALQLVRNETSLQILKFNTFKSRKIKILNPQLELHQNNYGPQRVFPEEIKTDQLDLWKAYSVKLMINICQYQFEMVTQKRVQMKGCLVYLSKKGKKEFDERNPGYLKKNHKDKKRSKNLIRRK
ncbi:unnamed protein product [Paramecium octaurelia]|uniref:Uncharacterized protein n=1 Tax=Paramecium octaurelia TaxID=43137 RepID=A0A8S1Y4N4_PAROT|nr:unnamed protein product [Paramecium octaurelia]